MNPDAIKLKAARINVDLTLTETAKTLGIAPSTLVSWEKYETSPSVVQAYQLSKLYKRPIDSIIFVV